jgi:hypothetical protein
MGTTMNFCPWCQASVTEADPRPTPFSVQCTQCDCLSTTRPVTLKEVLELNVLLTQPTKSGRRPDRPAHPFYFTVVLNNSMRGAHQIYRGWYDPKTCRILERRPEALS